MFALTLAIAILRTFRGVRRGEPYCERSVDASLADDTADGILMLGAYGWAYVKPVRKLYYNLNVTLVSTVGGARRRRR